MCKAYELDFDGVYFDNIDACVMVSENGLEWAASLNLSKLIVDSVFNISMTIKGKYGRGFKVFVNIGSAVELLSDPKFLSAIDGLLREEVWYTLRDGKSVRVPVEETATALKYLVYARRKGKIVMVADFLDSEKLAKEFCRLCWNYCFIPHRNQYGYLITELPLLRAGATPKGLLGRIRGTDFIRIVLNLMNKPLKYGE